MNEATVVRERVRQKLYALCSFDACCIRTVDPNNLLTTGALTDSDIEEIHPQLFVNEYLEGDIHSQEEMVVSGIPVKVLSSSIYVKKSKRLRMILQPAGFKDEMRIAFVTGDTCLGFASLYRRHLAFHLDEVKKIQKNIKNIVNILNEHLLTATHKAAPLAIQPMLIMSETFTIMYQNDEARKWIHQLCEEESINNNQLPRSIRSISYRLLKEHQQYTKIMMRDSIGFLYALEASRLTDYDGKTVIVIKKSPMSHEDWFLYLTKCYKWTAKESEIIRYLIKGDTTKEIAKQLSISPYTVQDHLKSIFFKTDINTRSKLISMVNGN
ncbi:helix-turn-helix transcriptional regulator [Gracilibacillus massiliensis]|uniref:helix-turn-helix transcriptional regulator n=1 Tax=Gracilibacillus massiliensis TaxID=1564956 RepID=UPI00071D3B04|nr:helix-turn-helix transcriptional regulator [Gracilibacillus massiliensis]